MTTLVVASLSPHELIDDPTREAVTAATALGDRVVLGIVADNPSEVVAMGGVAGVDDIVGVRISSHAFDHEMHQQAVRTIIDEIRPDTILMGFTARAVAFAAAIAQELDLGFASDVVRLERDETGGLVATRLIYGGKVQAEFCFDRAVPTLLLLRPSVWLPAEAAPPTGCQVFHSFPATSRIRHVGFASRSESSFDLTRQHVILSVGRGVGSQEGMAVFSEVAQKLGAALAASRPVVDAGWLPHDRQVGQSGVSIAPRIYLAFGISGAQQHLVGIQRAETIVAVNKDGNAPIFDIATYGAIADMFEVAEELRRLA